MIEKEKISLKKYPIALEAAKIYPKLNRSYLLFILKILASLGAFSGIILLLETFLDLDLNGLSIILRIILFIGLISFFILRFTKSYFRDLENKNKINPNSQTFEIFKITDLETTRILNRLNLDNPNSAMFFDSILKSSRVNFILNEMNATQDFIKNIYANLPLKDEPEKDILLEILGYAIENAIKEGEGKMTAGDIFYGFIKKSKNHESLLLTLELEENDLLNIIFWESSLFKKINHARSLTESLKIPSVSITQDWTSGYTRNLDLFSVNLTRLSYRDNFSAEGREGIIKQIENILSKESKNNCILTGANGVGKTALISGFARKIHMGDTLPELAYKKVILLDTGSLLAGAENERVVEYRLLSILNDAVSSGNVILFIDNIEAIFSGTAKIGTIDASEIITPYLEKTNLRIIGATTEQYYETYIVSKSTLASNFNKIEIPPMNEHETIRILEDLSLYYSAKYNIKITYNALKETYRIAERFIDNKAFPAKAVDTLNNICSTAKNSGIDVLDNKSIDSISEQMLNIPIKEAEGDEKNKLLNLEDEIHKRIIDQAEAVKSIADALRRTRTHVTENKRPIGSFLFLGPTGVGKTELTKALADVYFGNESNMIRMDMSEYQDISSIERFIGKKLPGIEQLEGGDFVKKVKEKPFSVVLLDEAEKAHPNILNLFLQILDEGNITDGMGEKVNFTNTIIIATSNAGANLIRDGVLEGIDMELLKERLLKYLEDENIYRPELLNRFDGVIIFKPLARKELAQIASLMFNKMQTDFEKKGYTIDIEEGALEKLAEMGYKPELGARPMRRVFQDVLESYLANKILEGKIQKGERFIITIQDIMQNSK